jgi:hypothetical protein
MAYPECVFVVLDIHHAMRMRYIVICGLSGYRPTTVFHIISQTTQFSKKKLFNVKYAFDFL